MSDTLKNKIIILSILFVALFSGFVFARASYSPSFQGYVEGSFTFPTADYLKTSQGNKLPAMRTSAVVAFDAMAANFAIDNLEFGAGFSLLYNTKSLTAGINFLRPYFGLGFATGVQYHFDCGFALGSKFRYLFCAYRPLNNRFDIMELEVSPSIDLVRNKHFETTLYMPVTCSYKSDSISVRVGVGCDVQYNLIFGAKHEK